jgi:hypothetical protein
VFQAVVLPIVEGSSSFRHADVGFIGPGLDNARGYERTHVDALRDAAVIVAEYLVQD